MLKFSIIVPIYKVQNYLDECIESILSQTYANIEVILVDDGSPDECPAICDTYAARDPRVIVIHKENGGLVSARQAGAQQATGNYICCVDGDDYIAPNYIEKMAEMVELYDADIVCCGYVSTSDRESVVHPIQFPSGFYDRAHLEREIYPSLLQNSSAGYFQPSLCMKAISRDLYYRFQMKAGSAISVGEDRAVSVPCLARCSSLAIIDDCLYYYRFNTQSMTRNKKSFPWNSLEALVRHLKREIDLTQFDFQAQYDRFVAHEFFNTAKSQFNRKEPYSTIRSEIIEKMNAPLFADAIANCHFTGSFRAKLMEICLKKRWIMPICIFNRVFGG